MGPRADLDALGVGRNLLPLPGIKPQFCRCPVHSLLTTLTMLSGIHFFYQKPIGRAKYMLKITVK